MGVATTYNALSGKLCCSSSPASAVIRAMKAALADESMEEGGWKMNETLRVGLIRAALLYKSVRHGARCDAGCA